MFLFIQDKQLQSGKWYTLWLPQLLFPVFNNTIQSKAEYKIYSLYVKIPYVQIFFFWLEIAKLVPIYTNMNHWTYKLANIIH